ncbi:MAG: GNAT family N-acetyltransferase [Clostridiaceae bacterium]|jgi:ribosomal protein S18 acetylase RimI-like enzyme|nr:GNAT family N-acetyltransferase [Clostridiaceae bacterium]
MFYSFIVRRGTEEDAPAVFSILQRAFNEYCNITGQTNLEALSETVEDIKKEIQTKAVYIAVINNNIVGTVRLSIKGDEAYLSRFAVDSNNQNAGIGKYLMQAVDTYLKEMGIKKVTLHTSSKHDVLMRFYYGIGFFVEAIETDRGYLRARMVKEY